jgi:L,D-peptidoglycan transpeptidase YkuD (ErfK/YbiS/YcfS/YnhG family)
LLITPCLLFPASIVWNSKTFKHSSSFIYFPAECVYFKWNKQKHHPSDSAAFFYHFAITRPLNCTRISCFIII